MRSAVVALAALFITGAAAQNKGSPTPQINAADADHWYERMFRYTAPVVPPLSLAARGWTGYEIEPPPVIWIWF